ncbi:MAG: ribosome biogenesis GTPase YlqF [Oscillospiraceae bacterium]|nr:ribosome biogenesis GTPase YlqF [Oscillospiraceae bacterium]
MNENNEKQNTKNINIHWYPGHMKKTERLIQKNLPLVDVVIELLDARIPSASANPVMALLAGSKPRVILLNKSDLADSASTKEWIAHFAAKSIPAMAVDCKNGTGLKEIIPFVKNAIIKSGRKSGGIMRMMIVGIPNVGKSSFINRLAGGRRTKTEDRPGVTRGKQWVTAANGVEILDMPGVLAPKIEQSGEMLAYTGAVKDTVIDTVELAAKFLELMAEMYPNLLSMRYKLDEISESTGYELLEAAARKRGMLISGGETDLERASIMVLDEFRAGKLGRITLERL